MAASRVKWSAGRQRQPSAQRFPLWQLEQEERTVSKRRGQLHNRIDNARGMGDTSPGAAEMLVYLLGKERKISDRRRELHRQIDELRSKAKY